MRYFGMIKREDLSDCLYYLVLLIWMSVLIVFMWKTTQKHHESIISSMTIMQANIKAEVAKAHAECVIQHSGLKKQHDDLLYWKNDK